VKTESLDPEIVEFLKDDQELLAVANLVIAAKADSPLPAAAGAPSGLAAGRRSPREVRPTRKLPRRRVVVASLVAGLAILVPTALALNDQVLELITGESPPSSVSGTFTEWNRMSSESAKASPGFDNLPQAVTERAHGVARLRTPGGFFDLWSAPEKGGGECFMVVSHPAAASAESVTSFGSCDSQLPRYLYSRPDVMVPWPVSFGNIPNVTVILVRVFNADSVELRLDGSSEPLRVVDDYVLAAVPADRIPPGQNTPVTLVAKDASGATIATDELRFASGIG
jgi:hypothetical protein